METEKIRILLTTIEDGTLSGAAEKLGYTPSGISRAIESLEDEIGIVLLSRSRQGVKPTASCQSLLPEFGRLIAAEQQIKEKSAAINGLESGELVIGSSYSAYNELIAELLASFLKTHPGIQVKSLEGSSSHMAASLENAKCDLCIISRRDGNFDWIPLIKDELVVVFNKSSQNDLFPGIDPSASVLPVSLLSGAKFIEILPGEETDNSLMLLKNHIRPDARFSCKSTDGALALAKAGLGYTIVNRILLNNREREADYLPLDPPWEVEIGIAVQSVENASPAARSFINHTKQYFGI